MTNKYNAKKTEYNGVIYDSKKEANRAMELDLMIKAGDVIKVERQPRFDIYVNGVFIAYYKADFKIFYPKGYFEVEDVKGMKTPVYRLKKKLVETIYGITINEI
jgi:hypothetical protein